MSGLSGYDSEAIGFDSVTQKKRSETSSSTQTNFLESGTASQTNMSKDCGCMATPEDLNAEDDILKEYPPPGLNEFLRRAVPAMLEQLDQNEKEYSYNSSDSEEDESIIAKLFQQIQINTNMKESGDYQSKILGATWSSSGNSLAVSIGENQHENWCEHDGLIRIYTVKRSEQDKLVHTLDISEKNCISVLKYHPSVSALLAYGTTSGEVVLCNLTSTVMDDGTQLSSPSGCHGSRRVSSLQWADAPLANTFLTIQINKTGKRRGASDQILISSGCDGTINIWQVNVNMKIFENVTCYNINGSRKTAAPDITCFDFIKTYPLRPCEEKIAEDIFVVGTKSGRLFLCKIKSQTGDLEDPVYDVLEGHPTCVLEVSFSFQKPGIFASISMDSELRVYDVNQSSPLKILCLDVPVSCMSWLPNNPCLVVLGVAKTDKQKDKQLVKVYNISSGRAVAVDGLTGDGSVSAITVSQAGSCRIAAGDTDGVVHIWDLPSRRIRLSPEDLEF